jgi:hypothetical protein
MNTDLIDVVCVVMDCMQLARRGPSGGVLLIFVFYSRKLSVAEVV